MSSLYLFLFFSFFLYNIRNNKLYYIKWINVMLTKRKLEQRENCECKSELTIFQQSESKYRLHRRRNQRKHWRPAAKRLKKGEILNQQPKKNVYLVMFCLLSSKIISLAFCCCWWWWWCLALLDDVLILD